jgi:hypothetical protein
LYPQGLLVHGSGFGINEQTDDNEEKSGHGGLLEMLTELGLVGQYLHRLESAEMDMVKITSTQKILGDLALDQALKDAGVGIVGHRLDIRMYLQQISSGLLGER